MAIQGSLRRGYVKRDLVIFCQNRQRIGADFIGYVAVGGNTVSAHPNRIDLALRHQAGGHRIGNQPIRHPQLTQLPGGQAPALQQRARFIHPDVCHFPLLIRQRNHPQRGADARRRQAAGIAVGQQAATRRHQRAARLGDAGAKLFILGDQAQRFRFQRLRIVLLRQRQLHAIQIIHQVHRRWTRGAQRLQRLR